MTLSVVCGYCWIVYVCSICEEEDGDCLGSDDMDGVNIVDDVAVCLSLRDVDDDGEGIVVKDMFPDWIC